MSSPQSCPYLWLATGGIQTAEVWVSLLWCADTGQEVGILIPHLQRAAKYQNYLSSLHSPDFVISRSLSESVELNWRSDIHTETQTHTLLLRPTCLDSKQCMMKTSAPCRLFRIVKIYATTVGPSSNRKAPNTHIRPSIHICAIAVTVKALQRKREDGGGGVRKRATDREWKDRLEKRPNRTMTQLQFSVWKTPEEQILGTAAKNRYALWKYNCLLTAISQRKLIYKEDWL